MDRQRMRHSLTWVALAMTMLTLAACDTEKVDVLKSPCVGLDDSPCGPKRVPTGNVV